MSSDGFRDLSAAANLRVAFDVWPPGAPLPATLDDVARAAFAVTLSEVIAGRAATVNLVRFAADGASVWRLDALEGVGVEDFVRAVVQAFEPHAFAVAVVQPMKAQGDPTVRGVHCKAMLGDEVIELVGDVVDGPLHARSVPTWRRRAGRATDDRGRWIGVPPTVEIRLPMRDAADA